MYAADVNGVYPILAKGHLGSGSLKKVKKTLSNQSVNPQNI